MSPTSHSPGRFAVKSRPIRSAAGSAGTSAGEVRGRPELGHDPANPLVIRRDAAPVQLRGDPGPSVASAVLLVDPGDHHRHRTQGVRYPGTTPIPSPVKVTSAIPVAASQAARPAPSAPAAGPVAATWAVVLTAGGPLAQGAYDWQMLMGAKWRPAPARFQGRTCHRGSQVSKAAHPVYRCALPTRHHSILCQPRLYRPQVASRTCTP